MVIIDDQDLVAVNATGGNIAKRSRTDGMCDAMADFNNNEFANRAAALRRAGGSGTNSLGSGARLNLGGAVAGRVVDGVAGSDRGQGMADPKDAGHASERGSSGGTGTVSATGGAGILSESECRRLALVERVRAKERLALARSESGAV